MYKEFKQRKTEQFSDGLPPMYDENTIEMSIIQNNRDVISYVLNKIRTFEINSHSNYGNLVADLSTRVNIVQQSLPSNLRLLLDKAIENTIERKPEMENDEQFNQDQENY
jgi:hypothetical protein